MAAFTQHNHISSQHAEPVALQYPAIPLTTFPMHPPPPLIQYPAATVNIPYAEPQPLDNPSTTNNENNMTEGSSRIPYCCGSHSCFRLGYKFCPSDQQLILNFLMRKVLNQSLPANEIIDFDIYQHHPSDLAEMFKQDDEEEEKHKCYFFTRRSRKKRQNRKVQNIGFWKAIETKTIIYARQKPYNDKFYGDIVCGDIIGTKRVLGFHEGSSSEPKKTNWTMHEYKLNADPKKTGTANDMKLDDRVLCRIYNRGKSFTRSSNHDDENEPLSLYVEELPSIQHDRHEFQLHDNQVPHEYFTINGSREIVGVPQLTLVSPSENSSNFNNHNPDPFAWELENYINIGEINSSNFNNHNPDLVAWELENYTNVGEIWNY